MKMNIILAFIITYMFVFTASAVTNNQVVNVKFGDNIYSGTGVVGSASQWNYFSGNSGSTLSGLFTSNGGSSNISIQVYYGSRFYGSSTSGDTPVKLLGSGLYGPFTFTISGLDISKSYVFPNSACL